MKTKTYRITASNHDHNADHKIELISAGEKVKRSADLMKQCGYQKIEITEI